MPKPLPDATAEDRASAADAALRLQAALDNPDLLGEMTAIHVYYGKGRGEWLKNWTGVPGFSYGSGGFRHALLPGWTYTKDELRTEMIPDLQKLALTGERPTVATR